jgi:hypothetical protein
MAMLGAKLADFAALRLWIGAICAGRMSDRVSLSARPR